MPETSAASPIRGRRFAGQALLMAGGTIGAQGLILASMPLLTRLYEPQAIALGAIFLSVSGALAVLATMRLDLAVVLPEEEGTAYALYRLIVGQALAVGVLMALTILVAGDHVAAWLGPGIDTTAWVWLLIPMVLGIACALSGVGMATRGQRFGAVVAANLANSTVFVLTAVIIGIWQPWELGIVDARLLGQVAMAVVVTLLVVQLRRTSTRARARTLWHEQRQFLYFNTPYSLISSLSRDLPLYFFALSGDAVATASYALARTVMTAPATLATASLSSVFYAVAARRLGDPALERLASNLTQWGLLLLAPVFAFVAVEGEMVFALVFGDTWRTAGIFASLLAVPMWLAMQTGWPERLYEATRRQGVSFSIQIGFDATQVLALFTGLALGLDDVHLIAVYAVVNSLFHLTYLTMVYRIAGFRLAPLLRLILRSTGVFLGLFAIFVGVRESASEPMRVFFALVVSLLAAVTGTLLCRRAASGAEARDASD